MNKTQEIRNWILCNLIERKENRFDKSSYVLKHDCEFALGYYVSNDEFKKQMRELEFKYKTKGLNDYYTLKNRLYQRQIAEINQFKWQQEQDKKCYHPLPYRLAKSDINFECTLCGKFI